MNGQHLYALYARKNIDIANCGVEDWDALEAEDREIWNAMAVAIADEFDPSIARAELVDQLEQAQSVIRQASLDTFGEELSVKEFADRSSYDS